ncbi:glucose dehydrogenase [Labrys miyagiensis]|uniref:Glucose dehydrogenase n=1 Tax=Labrys miyagiensis TaxID=346912 RepID=A0ABQ6CD77_9HYPH|nr:SDR family oxidoreductase [Labrys miyagiensis]GLS18211.1 glucose dehydrogenase [Labrys miyagiensis]
MGSGRTASLGGKVMIVTGASSGIGRAVARRFAEEGVKQVLVARSADKLAALAAEIGGETLTIAADLVDPSATAAVMEAAGKRFGATDILFANAGSYIAGDVADGNPDDWDKLLTLNINAVFRTVHAVLPGMIARRSGDIVVTSSVSGHQAIQWEPVYSASKHAVQSFVHGVRRQIAPHNVRIGSLAPGMVLNELWGITDPAEIERRAAERGGLRSEDVAEALLFMLTRPPNVTIRDLVMLPQNQDI